MDFPSREALEGLGAAEYGALVSMNGTVAALHAEWRSALALEMRLMNAADAAEGRCGDGGGVADRLGHEVAGELRSASVEFSKDVEVLLWRTASAYAVLGITVLDRLVSGRPPLSEPVVGKLCEEPLFGEFEAAVRIPVEHLLAARDEAWRRHTREGREKMAALVEQVYEVLADGTVSSPTRRTTAARGRLSGSAPKDLDEPWIGYMDPLVALARQTPFEISLHLKGRR